MAYEFARHIEGLVSKHKAYYQLRDRIAQYLTTVKVEYQDKDYETREIFDCVINISEPQAMEMAENILSKLGMNKPKERSG